MNIDKVGKLSDDKFSLIITNNKTYTDVYLCIFGMKPLGGSSLNVIKRRICNLKLDISHFVDGNYKKGQGRSLDEVLVKNSTYSRGNLKKRLLENGMLKNECSECPQKEEHNGKHLVMIIDHINGINNDHRLENLRMLCPNCNSQQKTFAGGNSKRAKTNKCLGCGVEVKKRNIRCLLCENSHRGGKVGNRKVERPPYEQLLQEIKDTSYCAVGRTYGVSDNAIRKWIKTYERQMHLD
jgi:5-methylcytosine-specific restriction endonuclease McrA